MTIAVLDREIGKLDEISRTRALDDRESWWLQKLTSRRDSQTRSLKLSKEARHNARFQGAHQNG
jgi:hypothetical protein